MFPPFLAKGNNATSTTMLRPSSTSSTSPARTAVGIGTDFTQDQDQRFFDWLTHDKGYARKLVHFEAIQNPEGIRTIGEFPNLTAALERAGWKESRIRKVMGENWVRVVGEVWGG